MRIKSIKKNPIPQPVYDVVNVKISKNFLVKTNSGKRIVLHNSFLEQSDDSKKAVEGNYDACVTGDTLIYTSSGFIPIIELMKLKDPLDLHSFNIHTNSVDISKYSHIKESGIKPLVELTFDNGMIERVTHDQLILVKTPKLGRAYRWVQAKDLDFDNEIMGTFSDLKSVRLTLKRYQPSEMTYDIVQIIPNHNFITKSGIVLHNCEQMYYAVYNRMLSRFMKNGKMPGLISMVSSPQFPDDFMSRKIEEAKAKEAMNEECNIFWRRRSTWEAKGEKHFPESRGHFYLDTELSEVVKNEGLAKMLSVIDKKHFPLKHELDSLLKISKYYREIA
ncbi:MAG: Hint domain-containing protein [archaeon]|nr:Hint domain-containing protein [archaeon]